jgi:hypothetical protein
MSTKLATEAKAELQRMIDIGAAHMRKQGCCSVNRIRNCVYRDAKGNKCFIGALIDNENYSSMIETGSIDVSGRVQAAVELSGYSIDNIILELQQAQERLHDELQFSSNFPAAFEEALITYCSEYELDYTAPGEMQ